MKEKFALHIYARNINPSAAGKLPIYIRITVNGQRYSFSTKRFVEPKLWSSTLGEMKGKSDEACSINTYLKVLKNKIFDIQMELVHNKVPLTIEVFKEKLNGTQERARMLMPIFQDHNDRIKELVGKEYAPGTLERYTTSLSHTKSFLEWKYKKSDIDILEINHLFITDYEFWLRSVRNCNNNTAVKYIKNFKKIIRICMANGWLDKDPFVNYKSKVREVEREFLTQEEINIIYEKKFVSPRLEQVRDIFVFSCFTGLAYIDVKQLTKANISIGIDGHKWIYIHRQKTEAASRIPLLDIPEEIILKYQDHIQVLTKKVLLPVLSNQKVNAYLKEIADVCGINKELTFHIARHTFATTVTLTNGVPIESVSKMLGHKSLKTTQHYAKILDQKVSDDMIQLRNKFAAKNNGKIENNS